MFLIPFLLGVLFAIGAFLGLTGAGFIAIALGVLSTLLSLGSFTLLFFIYREFA